MFKHSVAACGAAAAEAAAGISADLYFLGLGGILVAGVVGGLVLGLLVDEAAGTRPLWTLVGIAVGILLAVAAFVVRVRDALRE